MILGQLFVCGALGDGFDGFSGGAAVHHVASISDCFLERLIAAFIVLRRGPILGRDNHAHPIVNSMLFSKCHVIICISQVTTMVLVDLGAIDYEISTALR